VGELEIDKQEDQSIKPSASVPTIPKTHRYQHIQPKISSFRASSRKKSKEETLGPIIQINSKPKIPISKVKAVSKANKETFVMQKNTITQANQNFETVKNNCFGYKASKESKVN